MGGRNPKLEPKLYLDTCDGFNKTKLNYANSKRIWGI